MILSAAFVLGALSGCGAGRNLNGSKDSGNATAETEAPTDESALWNDSADVTDEGYDDGTAGEGYIAKSGAEGASYAESCYRTDEFIENTEEYSKWNEKGFSSVLNQSLSTFAADVDTASYSNLRRMILDGYLLDEIPEGAVRVEEMINYFTYDYKEPEGSEPFGVTTVISRCPWNEEAQLLTIGLKTQKIDYADAPASNLVFLLDVSGSMGDDDKLPLLQDAFSLLAENLTDKDRISIVTYASEDKVVLEGVSGDRTSKIKRALNALRPSGGTYGSKGIETAYRIAEENFIEGGNNRIILATDGDLNIGMTTEEELEALISEKKESGIFLSVLGFGTGNIKDNKMETLADKGNGNYAYIDSFWEAKKVLQTEMTATLLTICKDVKFQVEFNPAVVEQYRLIGYENRAMDRKDFDDDAKDAGEIGAGHSVTAMYELILKKPLGAMSESEIEDLKYSDKYKEELSASDADSKAMEEEWLTISIRYKKPAENTSNLLQYPVDYDSYTYEPGEDFKFAAAVAEFGLLASHSAYPEDASVEHVLSVLKGMELEDEYKAEFEDLVRKILLFNRKVVFSFAYE
ncbi:MAG: von Willebrand factor type A domain-containing protein [Lachnospiraceae bacterium]|nr:von Willebrand factor type A domain-containing protein [Lachnospiraceae bacterium]